MKTPTADPYQSLYEWKQKRKLDQPAHTRFIQEMDRKVEDQIGRMLRKFDAIGGAAEEEEVPFPALISGGVSMRYTLPQFCVWARDWAGR